MSHLRNLDDIRSDLEKGIALPENEQSFQTVWDASAHFEYPSVDTPKAWDKLQIKLNNNTSSTKKPISRWLAVAASISLLAVASWFYFITITKEIPSQVYSCDYGQQQKILLADSTEITLNGNSRLEIHADFGKNNRKVTLEGDALFKVKKNTKQPFIVALNALNVWVTGTTFRAHIEDKQKAQVSLLEGSVALYWNKEKTSLLPGQTAKIDFTDNSITLVSSPNNTSIIESMQFLYFEDETLSEICKRYQYYTGLRFQFPDSVAYHKLTTSLPLSDPNLSLNILNETLGIQTISILK
jgi:transmembrane sensor